MTRDKLVQALRMAGLSEEQVKEALVRLEWTDKLPKIARALARFGVPYATITVVGNEWLGDRLSEYIEELASILSPDLLSEAVEIMAQVVNDAVKGLQGYSRQLADKVA